MVTFVLALLAVLGFMSSLYFTLVHYRVMRPDAKFVPRSCQLSEETCQVILSTPDARVFGIPNFLLGLGYYLGLILLSMFGLVHPSTRGYEVLMVLSLFTVFLGVYLTHSLMLKLRVVCVLCIACHIINLVVAIILLSLWSL